MSAATALRVAHFSDLHYGPRNLEEADRCFGSAIDDAIEHGVDAAVISGDSTDHALELHAPAADRLVRRVRRLADHCPVLMLQGTWSHEPPGTLAVFRQLGGRYAVHVAERIGQVGLREDGGWEASESWAFEDLPNGLVALFSCLPSVNRAAVAAAVGAGAASEALGEQIGTLLRGFSPAHASARARGCPTLLVSHGTVLGSLNEHGVPMAGFDHEFTTTSLFEAGAQAVLLGHVHRHQCWTCDDAMGLRCIAYAGSIGRFHHGEAGDKGFLLWSVRADRAECRPCATPARRTIDIQFDGKPDLQKLREVVQAQPVDGAWVRVRWAVDEEDRHAVDRLAMQELLEGAAGVQFEGRIVPVMRTRASGIARIARLEGKVRAWADVVGAPSGPLLACLQALQSQESEGIAGGILSGGRSPETVSLASASGPAR